MTMHEANLRLIDGSEITLTWSSHETTVTARVSRTSSSEVHELSDRSEGREFLKFLGKVFARNSEEAYDTGRIKVQTMNRLTLRITWLIVGRNDVWLVPVIWQSLGDDRLDPADLKPIPDSAPVTHVSPTALLEILQRVGDYNDEGNA